MNRINILQAYQRFFKNKLIELNEFFGRHREYWMFIDDADVENVEKYGFSCSYGGYLVNYLIMKGSCGNFELIPCPNMKTIKQNIFDYNRMTEHEKYLFRGYVGTLLKDLFNIGFVHEQANKFIAIKITRDATMFFFEPMNSVISDDYWVTTDLSELKMKTFGYKIIIPKLFENANITKRIFNYIPGALKYRVLCRTCYTATGDNYTISPSWRGHMYHGFTNSVETLTVLTTDTMAMISKFKNLKKVIFKIVDVYVVENLPDTITSIELYGMPILRTSVKIKIINAKSAILKILPKLPLLRDLSVGTGDLEIPSYITLNHLRLYPEIAGNSKIIASIPGAKIKCLEINSINAKTIKLPSCLEELEMNGGYVGCFENAGNVKKIKLSDVDDFSLIETFIGVTDMELHGEECATIYDAFMANFMNLKKLVLSSTSKVRLYLENVNENLETLIVRNVDISKLRSRELKTLHITDCSIPNIKRFPNLKNLIIVNCSGITPKRDDLNVNRL